ncbi:hypothetical protein MMC20_005623 [Loxospora ochrophaea]|nr:hypothetical protein [Loxospora ochrophaea]
MLIGSFENLEEHEEEVQSIARLADTNATVTIRSKYVVGCDGAKSRVRKTIGIGGLGEQLPVKFFLVHFRSRDLVRLQSQGQFWHIFYTNGGILISQDEKEIWTVHLPFPLDVDTSTVDSLSVIYTVLGGSIGPFEVQVDEVMIGNTWRPGTYIADSYRSPLGRVFLAGDSAHQCIPTGAYGMNTGVEDAYDIAWKLAAVLLGFGGEQLLRSYEIERRPIGLRNSSRSSELMHKHLQYLEWIRNAPNDCLTSFGSEEGELLRQKVADYITKNDTEITENGMVLDHRHLDSPVLALDLQLNEQEPPWILTHYTPSTLPGHRAPHLILSDGLTSIYALYGPWYSIVDFSSHGSVAATFSDIAFQLRIPLKLIRLPLELHVKNIWKCEAVLLRPDGHVAWQKSPTGNVDNVDTIRTALLTATGLR